MATRYWVGGTGNTNSTTHWSASSGGASGASVPVAGDDIVFDANSASGTYVVTINAALACNSFKVLALPTSATLTVTGTPSVTIAGAFALLAGVTWSATGLITFNGTSGTASIDAKDLSLACSMTINGVGGAWTLASALRVTGTLTHTNGSFDAAGQAVRCGRFSGANTNTRTLKLGGGAWHLTNASLSSFILSITSTGLTFDNGGSTINVDDLSAAVTISAAGVAFGPLVVTVAGAHSLTLLGSGMSFTSVTGNVPPYTWLFAGPNVSAGAWNLSGTAGNVSTIGSDVAGTQRTVNYSGMTPLALDYVTVKDIRGNEGASVWTCGRHATDAGNNRGIGFLRAANTALQLLLGP